MQRPIIDAINDIEVPRVYTINGQMATFSSTISNVPTIKSSNSSSTTSSLSYHHLQSPLTSVNNHHLHSHHQHGQNNNISPCNHSTTSHDHHLYENNPSYLNSSEFTFTLPSSQVTNPFDAVVSAAAAASSSPSHFNTDPLVRHFFHYRANEANYGGNYYPNMSSGSIVNSFDYPYPNLNSTTTNLSLETTSNGHHHHHSFNSTLPSQQGHSLVHSYIPYQHSMQPILKGNDSFAIPIQSTTSSVPPPLRQQQQQTQHQPSSHSQNIYPWMRRIHHNCGKSDRISSLEVERRRIQHHWSRYSCSLPFFSPSVYIRTRYAQSFLWPICVVFSAVRRDLWARSG